MTRRILPRSVVVRRPSPITLLRRLLKVRFQRRRTLTLTFMAMGVESVPPALLVHRDTEAPSRMFMPVMAGPGIRRHGVFVTMRLEMRMRGDLVRRRNVKMPAYGHFAMVAVRRRILTRAVIIEMNVNVTRQLLPSRNPRCHGVTPSLAGCRQWRPHGNSAKVCSASGGPRARRTTL